MNDTDGLTHQMLVRSREAFAQNVNDFSEGGAARQLYADLQTTIIEVEQNSAAFGSGRSDAKQGTQTLNEAREDLLADLFAIREAAKVMGVEEKFPYPPIFRSTPRPGPSFAATSSDIAPRQIPTMPGTAISGINTSRISSFSAPTPSN